jgi:excisionase family DNA binding protein
MGVWRMANLCGSLTRSDTMKVKEAASRLEISPSLVYLLISEGKLRATRHGIGRGTLRISEDQLAAYLESACGKPLREQLRNLRMS